MLGRCDAALIIGDNALLLDPTRVEDTGQRTAVEKIDLGDAWTAMTGLPFVYAFWAGRLGSLSPDEVSAIQAARDAFDRRQLEASKAT